MLRRLPRSLNMLHPTDAATILLPVTSSTTLSALRSSVLEALKHGGAEELKELDMVVPTTDKDIALWKRIGGVVEASADDEQQWERLKDEKSGADKWGL